MASLVVLCVIMVQAALASDNVADLCPGTVPLKRVPASGVGTWFTTMASEARLGYCGLHNNQPPCKCTGFIFTSEMEPPYISKYNSTMFGFDTVSQRYDKQKAKLSLVDDSKDWAIFNFTDESTGGSMVISALDTDNHKTFIIFYVCGLDEGIQTVIVVSKNKEGLCKKSQARVDRVLKNNNIYKDNLKSFDTSDCPAIE